MQPNGVRYLRVGGTRERCFDGIELEPRNLPKNAATPTRRVHAVLGVPVKHRALLDRADLESTTIPPDGGFHVPQHAR